MRISEVTRRNIIDGLTVENVSWSGRIEETQFLARLYDLSLLPSHDGRFSDAEGDIWQHRTNNHDWDDDWVFFDGRFNLLHGKDEVFLRFLCEMIHPVVRPDPEAVQRLLQMFNELLRPDGFQIVEKTKISGRPVFAARQITAAVPPVSRLKKIFEKADTSYVAQQITRMEAAVEADPALAIGTAKELVETCCKTILTERKVPFTKSTDLPDLVKLTAKTLALTPADIPEKAAAAESIRRLLSNLGTITMGIAELRNFYGTGHGKHAKTKGLLPRHARLAVGAASTLAMFLIETHETRTP
jgi:hypothetical protein